MHRIQKPQTPTKKNNEELKGSLHAMMDTKIVYIEVETERQEEEMEAKKRSTQDIQYCVKC